MPDDHISAAETWELLNRRQGLSSVQEEHVRSCRECADFLRVFRNLAEAAGIHCYIRLPDDDEYEKRTRRHSA